jgi:hypothetical protein
MGPDVVGEQAQLRLLVLHRVPDPDVLVDVVEHGERAAHAPADLAVGEQRDAHPAQLAGRLAVAPLVRHRRAGERTLDVRLHLGERVGREELRELVADQVVRLPPIQSANGLFAKRSLRWRSKYRIGRPTLSVTRRSRCSRWPASISRRRRWSTSLYVTM